MKELTAEYVALKEQLDAYKPDLAELKSKLTDLKQSGITTKYLSGTFRKQINITAKEIV